MQATSIAISPGWRSSGTAGVRTFSWTPGSQPRIRVDGKLTPIEGTPVLTSEQIEEIVRGMLSPRQAQHVRGTSGRRLLPQLTSTGPGSVGAPSPRRASIALALRMIPSRIPTFDELGLPPVAEWLARLPRGLVLVTGPTGSGKSTTLASILVASTRPVSCTSSPSRIRSSTCTSTTSPPLSQREVGTDSPSFERALRSALREDPDVLLVGEMRDLDSIQLALTLAETGHLVFSTLHTNDASQAIDRIIDVFPAWRQEQIRVQLGASLAGGRRPTTRAADRRRHGCGVRDSHRQPPGAEHHPGGQDPPAPQHHHHEPERGHVLAGVEPGRPGGVADRRRTRTHRQSARTPRSWPA